MTPGLLLAVLATGCAGSPVNCPPPAESNPVYMVSHGWHTGVVVAADNLGPELAFLERYFNNAQWYEFGWGDREFYPAEQTTTGMMLRAALWPTDAVMHVVALPRNPAVYFANSRVIGLQLGDADHAKLTGSVAEYFKHDEHGGVMMIGEGLYGDSRFFEAEGRFHIFNTCNTWTAKMLRRADVPVRTFMTLRAESVMNQVEDVSCPLAAGRSTAAGAAPGKP